jgi:hypothetical protein
MKKDGIGTAETFQIISGENLKLGSIIEKHIGNETKTKTYIPP